MTEDKIESKEQGSILKGIGSAFNITFKTIRFAFKAIRMTVFTLLLVGSLALSATMLFWQTGALAVSGAIAGIMGIRTVVTSLVDNAATLRNKNRQITKNNADLRKNNANLRNNNTDLKNRNTQLLASNDSLKKNNANLSKNNTQLLAKNAKIQQTTKRVSNRVAIVAARNLGSIPAEALPYVGVAVVVGVTALEIKDACATMQDMKEIRDLLDIDDATEDNTTADTNTVCGYEVPKVGEVWEKTKNSPAEAWNAMSQWEVDLPPWDSVKDKTKSLWDKTVDGTQSLWGRGKSLWENWRGN